MTMVKMFNCQAKIPVWTHRYECVASSSHLGPRTISATELSVEAYQLISHQDAVLSLRNFPARQLIAS